MPLPLSVVIIAKNEHNRIKDCLESVYGWVDEIVVVDDESTDDTRAIAHALHRQNIHPAYGDRGETA